METAMFLINKLRDIKPEDIRNERKRIIQAKLKQKIEMEEKRKRIQLSKLSNKYRIRSLYIHNISPQETYPSSKIEIPPFNFLIEKQ
jgi:hypothetical protein